MVWVGNLVLVILGLPLLEEKLRKALTNSPDGPSVFVTRFISLTMLVLSALLLLLVVIPFVRRQREESFREP